MNKTGKLIMDIEYSLLKRFRMAVAYTGAKSGREFVEKALSKYLDEIEPQYKEEITKIFYKEKNLPDDIFKTEVKEYKALGDEEENTQ